MLEHLRDNESRYCRVALRCVPAFRFEEILRLSGRMDTFEFFDPDDHRILPCHVSKNQGMMPAQTFDKGAHGFLIDHGTFTNMAHVIVKGEIQEKEIIHLPQDSFVESANHVRDKETGDAEMPRARDDIANRVMADVEVRFLEEDKRETACATLQLTFTDLPNNVNDCLHKSLPRQVCEARNINHQCAAVADLIVLRLQRGGFTRLLGEYPGVACRLKTTTNCRAHPFILGKFQLLGHIN